MIHPAYNAPTARQIYRANASELRAFGRFEKTEAQRKAKIAEACKSRAFWFGDSWTQPASVPAQNALRVVQGMHADPLCLNAMMAVYNINNESRRVCASVVLGALRLQRS